ncbi:cuticle protein 38-like [Nymphalis io]|uniref:cuticle protein 38-like n=1 Tax=Inachis io TaxID=171585 RepID=UPI0021697D7A|nr:cuticle protein 38-like [Nymphalis io]
MFKLVVLCAFLAAAVGEPSVVFSPLAYSRSYISPATTTITNQASSVIHPSPAFYSAPWAYSAPVAHLIKKRSPGFIRYNAPSSYIAPTSFLTSYAAAPLATTYSYTAAAPFTTTYSAPIYSPVAHLIKKRSAGLILPTSYIAPTYAAATPLVASTYIAHRPILSTPFVSATPITYSHLIKKRSVLLDFPSYSAPASFSHQSRVDIKSSPAITYSYSSPALYSSPAVYASPAVYSSPALISHI